MLNCFCRLRPGSFIRSAGMSRKRSASGVLALVTIVLAIADDLVRARIQPPLRYWVDGRVYAPPTDPTADVPRATAYFSTHEQGVVQTCTDTYGHFVTFRQACKRIDDTRSWVTFRNARQTFRRRNPVTFWPGTKTGYVPRRPVRSRVDERGSAGHSAGTGAPRCRLPYGGWI